MSKKLKAAEQELEETRKWVEIWRNRTISWRRIAVNTQAELEAVKEELKRMKGTQK